MVMDALIFQEYHHLYHATLAHLCQHLAITAPNTTDPTVVGHSVVEFS